MRSCTTTRLRESPHQAHLERVPEWVRCVQVSAPGELCGRNGPVACARETSTRRSESSPEVPICASLQLWHQSGSYEPRCHSYHAPPITSVARHFPSGPEPARLRASSVGTDMFDGPRNGSLVCNVSNVYTVQNYLQCFCRRCIMCGSAPLQDHATVLGLPPYLIELSSSCALIVLVTFMATTRDELQMTAFGRAPPTPWTGV